MNAKSPFKIFIVEDDPWYGQLLKYHLSLNPDYEVSLLTTGKDCLDQLSQKPDVVCIDYNLPDTTGDKLLTNLKSVCATLPVVVISGQEEIAVALNLLKLGAAEYIVKDEHTKDMLWNTVRQLRENATLRRELTELTALVETKFSFEKNIIGESPALKKTFALMQKAASTLINVSITGETGTGKEVVAKSIHFNSDRKKKPFVTVNMAAIPADLLESELFGHERGAFTGAVAQRIGKFEEANGGTIFLDEVADLDLNLQAKLLRVLQEREVVRVGGNQRVKLDVRVITATHKHLGEQVKQKQFREDLYYRVLGLPIELPPLRERGQDILLLAQHFVNEFAAINKIKSPQLRPEAKEKLMHYNYPGNVRELKAVVDLACVMGNGAEVTAHDICFSPAQADQEFTVLEKTMQQYSCDIIAFYLKKYNNNVVLVANKLDIGKSTIYNLLKRNEISLS
ncbi:sigma-54-dependent transcriptional regulator [Chryseolinea lacunae]|uniref:Sigma-54-dependent Fis family transcriptional regulator n=1 Tax=Chryseolinea lacunae TaxID=2801331 RepID=A0ABS1L2A5_9BACT|nr:sigma-54 dependent transcriptional regulator [Chryseolinea lacunae]MBL0745833.1 sigma-54-dependent Fis family transcriptional regulator [Chryseolinea lacunae]